MRAIHPIIPATAVAFLMLTACGRQPGQETERVQDQVNENAKEMAKADDQQEWLEERAEATREMTALRERLDQRLIREQKRLADGIKDKERRAECEAHIKELQANIARIDASMGTMGGSTATDWQHIKGESRTMMDSTTNWFDRQVEKIDKRTDADKDNDGH
ncbi:MAG TPA: hypothetical protein VGE21_11990 [Flavobacteriales bacterium]